MGGGRGGGGGFGSRGSEAPTDGTIDEKTVTSLFDEKTMTRFDEKTRTRFGEKTRTRSDEKPLKRGLGGVRGDTLGRASGPGERIRARPLGGGLTGDPLLACACACVHLRARARAAAHLDAGALAGASVRGREQPSGQRH